MTVITREIAKLHCRVDGNHEDALIDDYIAAAIAWVEHYCGLSLAEAQITETFSCFKSELKLATKPVRSVESITYLDQDGAEQTFSDFRLYRGNRLIPQVGFSWPNALSKSDVEIAMTVGFDDGQVPHDIKQAVRLLISHQYENRDAVIVGTIASELPMGITSLLHSHRGESV